MGLTEFDRVVLKKDPDYGGVGVLLTGKPGCGKTNALARMAIMDLENGIKVMWRAKSTCQWSVFLKEGVRLVFWVKEGLKCNIIDRESGKEEYLSRYGRVIHWEHPEDVIQNLESGVINVVEAIPINEERDAQQKMFVGDWVGLMGAAIRKMYPDPISIYFDELEDLCPESKPGFYKKSLAIAGKQKELRKNKIHFIGATHRVTEIFWVMRNKLPWKIYMHGAVPLKGSNVFQRSIDKLEAGFAFIEDREFQKIYFKFVDRPKDMFNDITLSKELEKAVSKQEKELWDKEKEPLTSFVLRLSIEGYSEHEIAKRADVSQPRISQVLEMFKKTNLPPPDK